MILKKCGFKITKKALWSVFSLFFDDFMKTTSFLSPSQKPEKAWVETTYTRWVCVSNIDNSAMLDHSRLQLTNTLIPSFETFYKYNNKLDAHLRGEADAYGVNARKITMRTTAADPSRLCIMRLFCVTKRLGFQVLHAYVTLEYATN